MPEETKNTVPQGWKDVQLNSTLPLDALVGFLNVVNQRLVVLEDHMVIDGKTVTTIYHEQAEAEMKAQAEAAAAAAAQKPTDDTPKGE